MLWQGKASCVQTLSALVAANSDTVRREAPSVGDLLPVAVGFVSKGVVLLQLGGNERRPVPLELGLVDAAQLARHALQESVNALLQVHWAMTPCTNRQLSMQRSATSAAKLHRQVSGHLHTQPHEGCQS